GVMAGGLGIGLTLVKRLVELHGGSVEVRSDGPAKGCEFMIRLPAVLERSGETEAAGESEAAPPRSRAVGAPGLRVLVADDNVDAASSLAMLLRITGHDVRVAHDGLEAIAI